MIQKINLTLAYVLLQFGLANYLLGTTYGHCIKFEIFNYAFDVINVLLNLLYILFFTESSGQFSITAFHYDKMLYLVLFLKFARVMINFVAIFKFGLYYVGFIILDLYTIIPPMIGLYIYQEESSKKEN